MDPSTSALSDQTHYEQVCQGLRSFFVCVIEEEGEDGTLRLLAHETSLRHSRFEDAKERQQAGRRYSRSRIAECTILDDTEVGQDPVTVEELAELFNAMSRDVQIQSPWAARKAKRRVAAWLRQNSTPTPRPF